MGCDADLFVIIYSRCAGRRHRQKNTSKAGYEAWDITQDTSKHIREDATWPDKKIFYFGWDMPGDTGRILDNIDTWQDLPFDGMTVRIRDYCFSL